MSGDIPSRALPGAPRHAAQDEPQGPEGLTVFAWSTTDAGGEDTRSSQGFEISAVREGSGILRLNDDVTGFSKGDLLLVPPGRRHCVMARDAHGVSLLTLRCPEALASWVVGEDAAGDPAGAHSLEALQGAGAVIHRDSRTATLGAALIHQIRTLQGGHGRGGSLRLRSRILDLLGLLLDHGAAPETDVTDEPRPRTRRREMILGLVEAMARADVSDLSVEDAARGLNLSVRHFRRLFREQTGRSFHDFLTELRVEHAKHLLQRSDRKIIEVAWETGYGSLSQFNLVFKKMTGESPGQFRARLRVRA